MGQKWEFGPKFLFQYYQFFLKFTFSEKATKIDKIFPIDLTFTTQRQIDGEDLTYFCDLLKKHKL